MRKSPTTSAARAARTPQIRAAATTAAELTGIALITAGIAFIFMPAAFIFAGGALVFLGWVNGR